MTTPIDLAGLIGRLRERFAILSEYEGDDITVNLIDEAADALELALAVTEPFAALGHPEDNQLDDETYYVITKNEIVALRDFRNGIIKERT